MKKYVYSFGNGTADGDGKMKDMLGGKGAGLAEMSPGQAAGASRLHHLHRSLQHLLPEQEHRSGGDRRADARSPQDAGRAHGAEARRRRQPAAGERALRRQVLHAGHDGHHPQPGPERRDREGRWKPRATTRASPTIATAASSRCTATWCWRSPSTISTRSSTARRRRPRPSSIPS